MEPRNNSNNNDDLNQNNPNTTQRLPGDTNIYFAHQLMQILDSIRQNEPEISCLPPKTKSQEEVSLEVKNKIRQSIEYFKDEGNSKIKDLLINNLNNKPFALNEGNAVLLKENGLQINQQVISASVNVGKTHLKVMNVNDNTLLQKFPMDSFRANKTKDVKIDRILNNVKAVGGKFIRLFHWIEVSIGEKKVLFNILKNPKLVLESIEFSLGKQSDQEYKIKVGYTGLELLINPVTKELNSMKIYGAYNPNQELPIKENIQNSVEFKELLDMLGIRLKQQAQAR
jgi:hypothetical protein